jgi:LCP family protein required for cell wall assembly
MRDLRVDIHGHGTSKLGHAYSYGGGELLIRTLNENYGLAIDNYIALNFSSFEKIIDLFGGLELDIDIHEKNEINKVVKEPDIETTGMQLLNGKQTLAYSRIREVGRADFERTERQRRIVEELIRNSAALSLTELYNLALNIKGLLEMNLDLEEILQLIYVFDNYREKIEIKSIRFPIDGSFRSGIISGVYYLIPLDENATRYLIRSHIYGNN